MEGSEEVCGVEIECPSCLQSLVVPDKTRAQIVSSQRLSIPEAPSTQAIPYAVKVLTTKDRAFSGKFNPQTLEAALNSYASEGWTLAGCDSAEFPGLLGGVRSELISVMHRVAGTMKKYKILTQKDRFFGGKFDPMKLEAAINAYVPEGWRVRAVTTATSLALGRPGKR
jgi:hypothetical protein